MSLSVTPMSRSLDKKLLVLGFEIPDLLAIFLTLAVLNFLFGGKNAILTIAAVWLPPVTLAVALYIGKKGRPENFLLHSLRYYFTPGIYSAFKAPSKSKTVPKISQK